jgi:hypothetical protein
VKNDPSLLPPVDASVTQAVTPSGVYVGRGQQHILTRRPKRTGIENNWYALTGRVVAVKVEVDGDLHLAIADATGDRPGIVVCEVRVKSQRCEMCNAVFGWTHTRFPFHTSSSAKKLTFDQTPVITVIGKAYFDVGHSLKDQLSNRRSHLPATPCGKFIR